MWIKIQKAIVNVVRRQYVGITKSQLAPGSKASTIDFVSVLIPHVIHVRSYFN